MSCQNNIAMTTIEKKKRNNIGGMEKREEGRVKSLGDDSGNGNWRGRFSIILFSRRERKHERKCLIKCILYYFGIEV